jgi:uncharacterized metal-binding protein
MEVSCYSEISDDFQQTTHSHSLGDVVHHNYCRENLKSYENYVIDLFGNFLLKRKYHLYEDICYSSVDIYKTERKRKTKELNKGGKNLQIWRFDLSYI